MNVNLGKTACVLLMVGLAATGCGRKKEQAPVSAAAVTNSQSAPEPFKPVTRDQQLAQRAKQHQALLAQTLQVQQQTVTNLLDLTGQMSEVETAARTNNPALQAAYEAMVRARDDYEAMVASLPEMKPLATRREELQEVYRKMSERKQSLEQEKTTP